MFSYHRNLHLKNTTKIFISKILTQNFNPKFLPKKTPNPTKKNSHHCSKKGCRKAPNCNIMSLPTKLKKTKKALEIVGPLVAS
jgi:hypothetical protein